jgi:hypothetical protein
MCGGDASKCDYDPASDICTEMERRHGEMSKEIYERLQSPGFTRKLIPLKPGEAQTCDLLIGVVEGFRLETDDEFRQRIFEALKQNREECRAMGIDAGDDPGKPPS